MFLSRNRLSAVDEWAGIGVTQDYLQHILDRTDLVAAEVRAAEQGWHVAVARAHDVGEQAGAMRVSYEHEVEECDIVSDKDD